MRRRSRALVLAVRLAVVLGAGCAAAAAFIVIRPGDTGGRQRAAAPAFRCPMHPEVTSARPSGCPICGMALEGAPAPPSPQPTTAESVAAVGVRTSDVTIARPRAVSVGVDAPGWLDGPRVVKAVVYRDELLALAPGDQAWFQPARAPETRIELRLAGGTPEAWDDSTSLVGFAIAAGEVAARHLPVGAPGRVSRPAQPREVLAIPETTVVRTPHGPCVFVAASDGTTFTRRYVELGRSFFDANAVVSGLRAGEIIAVAPAFFMDAELRLQAAAAPATGGNR